MKTYLNKLLGGIPAFLVSLAIVFTAGPASAVETITYYHNDIAGTPILATDAAGAVLWKENYRPYGDKLNNPPAGADNKLGFTGKPYDANTGLSYMGARYYDPVIGRFAGIDPVGFDESNLHSFNRYTYANNNPYKFIDPDGRAPWLVVRMLMPPPAAGGATGGGFQANKSGDSSTRLIPPEVSVGIPGTSMSQETSGSAGGFGEWIRGKLDNLIFNNGDDQGCIYCVKGDKTSSGKDYVGSTDNLGQRQRDKSDGRDREGAEVIGTYPKSDRDVRRTKEQQAINDRGGVERLDNKRNEVSPKKWPNMGITPP